MTSPDLRKGFDELQELLVVSNKKIFKNKI
jgi:hypothetical protein